jgi:hypothetical protein
MTVYLSIGLGMRKIWALPAASLVFPAINHTSIAY